jgi:hypothetical protein
MVWGPDAALPSPIFSRSAVQTLITRKFINPQTKVYICENYKIKIKILKEMQVSGSLIQLFNRLNSAHVVVEWVTHRIHVRDVLISILAPRFPVTFLGHL